MNEALNRLYEEIKANAGQQAARVEKLPLKERQAQFAAEKAAVVALLRSRRRDEVIPRVSLLCKVDTQQTPSKLLLLAAL